MVCYNMTICLVDIVEEMRDLIRHKSDHGILNPTYILHYAHMKKESSIFWNENTHVYLYFVSDNLLGIMSRL